jgi:hypothetical protein
LGARRLPALICPDLRSEEEEVLAQFRELVAEIQVALAENPQGQNAARQ